MNKLQKTYKQAILIKETVENCTLIYKLFLTFANIVIDTQTKP